MAPPVRQSQSCGGAPAVKPGAKRPECCPRRTRSHPRAGGHRGPRRPPQRSAGPWAGRAVPAAGALRHRGPRRPRLRAPRGRRPRRRRRPREHEPRSPPARGRWACRDRRRTRPATCCRRARGGAGHRAARQRTRPDRRVGRPAVDPHRARGAPGRSRRAAWRRWLQRRGPQRRARARGTLVRRRTAPQARPSAAPRRWPRSFRCRQALAPPEAWRTQGWLPRSTTRRRAG